MIGSGLLLGLTATWLTPVWLICVGVALGLAILSAIYGILALVAPRWGTAVSAAVKEGPLLPLFYLSILLSVVAVVGSTTVPMRSLFLAASRIGNVGDRTTNVEIPPTTKNFAAPLTFRAGELRKLTLESDQPITISTHLSHGAGLDGIVKLKPGQSFDWARSGPAEKPFSSEINEWTVANFGASPADLRIHTTTDIEYPEARGIVYTALAMLVLFGLYMGLRIVSPKIAAIALATSKESTAQPLFYLVMAIGVFLLMAFVIIPYNTFGEDVKMLKDSGLVLILVLAIVVALWSASVSVAEEIEGRTALTLLSKPVSRRQFLLGKFLGIIGPVMQLFIVLGVVFLFAISYKVVYDAREVASTEPSWQTCYLEMIRVVPGLVLAFLETVVLASISVAISTRLPMLANLIVCSSIYVLGHLVPMLVASSVGKFEIVKFVGQFIATVLPVLDHFNIQAAVAGGVPVPMSYLGLALLYCFLYSTVAMLLGLALFEDRDLA